MSITLPDDLLEWVERQVESGAWASVNDYVVALVRRDMGEHQQLAQFQDGISAGIASGISDLSLEEVLSDARGLAAHDSPS